MRPTRWIAQLIVEAAGTGIGTVQDLFDPCQPLVFALEGANGCESSFQPAGVVQRMVDLIQVGAALHGQRLVLRHAELCANALEQRLSQLENTPAQLLRDR